MKTLLFCFYFLLTLPRPEAQVWTGGSVHKLHKKLKRYHPELLQRSDSIVEYALHYSKNETEAVITARFHLTKNGKIRVQKISTDCLNCFRSYLDDILAQKKYKWKKVNGNQYVSGYSRRLLLETDPESKPELMILKTSWSKRSYRILFE